VFPDQPDKELLDQLGAALANPALPIAPSKHEVEALQAVVARQGVVARHGARRTGRRGSVLGVVVAASVLASGGAAAAATFGAVPPRIVRQVAYSAGFPVTDPRVDDVHHAVHRLLQAEARRDPAAISQASIKLNKELKGLNGHELGAIKRDFARIAPSVAAAVASTSDQPTNPPADTGATSPTTALPDQPAAGLPQSGNSSSGNTAPPDANTTTPSDNTTIPPAAPPPTDPPP
jgi:hypothetical protein